VSTPSRAVFLSYASEDADAARYVRDALRGAGIDVWFDENELRGGDAWDLSIRRRIKECALFVPVISANTDARSEGYFRREWNLAVDRTLDMADDQAFLLPVVIDATQYGSARVPAKFREVQWTRLPAGSAPSDFTERVLGLLSEGRRGKPVVSCVAKTPPADVSTLPASIAVLPFVNRSHDDEDEYFAEGLADELLNVLSKIGGLRVAARSSTFTFKGTRATVAEIGRALNVSTLLEGSVRKAGNQLRISVQLVNVADGYHLWSERYDGTLDDIFALQDDIAQSVVMKLRSTLLREAGDSIAVTDLAEQVAAAARGRAVDPQTHQLFLQARFLIDRGGRDDTSAGIEYLRQALQRDPDFALAYVQLAVGYVNQANSGWTTISNGYTLARDAVTRALTLDARLAEGYGLLAWIQICHDWDWRGAEASSAKAVELAPENHRVLRTAGAVAITLGRCDEAIHHYRRMAESDPLSANAYHNLGTALYSADRFVEAEHAYRKALELNPQRELVHAFLALNLLAQGRADAALACAQAEPEEAQRLMALSVIRHAAGKPLEADATLRELVAKHGDLSAYQVAAVYAVRGESDRAFAWLDRARAQRDPGLHQTKADPLLGRLHADSRWNKFLREMGLPS